MASIVLAVAGVLIVSGLLVWLISAIFAGRKEIAGQAAGIGLLQQQLEALRAAQDGIRDALQKSLQTGQENISRNLQSSQQILSRLNKTPAGCLKRGQAARSDG